MNKNTTTNLIIALLLGACATGKSPEKTAGKNVEEITPLSASAPSAIASKELIMIATGAKLPILPDSNDVNWVEMSQSTSSIRDRMYGLLATGQAEPAIEEGHRILEQQPGDLHVILALGVANGILHNYEMAGYYGDIVLKSKPESGDAMNLIGLRTMMASGNRRGDFEDAIAWFRKAADNDNTHVAGLLNMGYLQLELGDAQSAVESFDLASSRCKNCSTAQFALGLAAARSANWSKAQAAFEGILNADKNRADAQYQLALVQKNGLNNPSKAISLLQAIVSDADGRFQQSISIKRVANVTLRQMKATDADGKFPDEGVR
jgi:tetratricopeptide (TPR) repeat protein